MVPKIINKIVKRLTGLLLLAGFLVLQGCDIETSLQQQTDQDDGLQPKLREIETEIFAKRCATSGCHTSASKSANLDLSPGNAYANLVGVKAFLSTESLNLVEPGNSSQSFLIQVLDGSNPTRMPIGGAPLDAATIDIIAEWIDNGAIDN
ncbi:MAG: hypothetical protein DWQ10_02205 [Calditrichaeota bacterium]|nr:MAG: hypothetical protein DWQ10_02205 [Calditrichota bacterium]